MPSTSDDALIFEGLKVIDAASWIAGPVAATILADFGASVIKIEQPGVGDPYRRLAELPGTPKAPVNYDWVMDARNKRGIALNLKSEEGRDILLKLVRECDVFVTNQPPPMRRAMRLTYADLAPVNERMIYASLTAYGETGPDADREGFDGVAWWARSGLMDLVRSPGSVPGGSVPGMGDHPSAVSLYAAIVTALMRRERTGKGGHVHTNLLSNGLWSNACLAQAGFVGGEYSQLRSASRIVSPNRNVYDTADGRLLQLYMVRTQPELDAMLIAAEAGDILADPRFGDAEGRAAHMSEFIEALRALFLTRTAGEWMAAFRAANVPVSHVAEVEDLPNDPQIHAIGAVERPNYEAPEGHYIIRHPVFVDGLARVGPKPAPEIGEHTDEVLAELGYTPEMIAAAHANGVV